MAAKGVYVWPNLFRESLRPRDLERARMRPVREEFWAGIREGLPIAHAASLAGISYSRAADWFAETGGVKPARKASSGRYLTASEREEIAILRAKGYGVRAIARELSRPASTISREVRRNGEPAGAVIEYRPLAAQAYAERQAARPKISKLDSNIRLRTYIIDRLSGRIRLPRGVHKRGRSGQWKYAWSPQQICARLAVDFPDDESMRISHESLYRWIYVNGKGALRRDLEKCLRTGRAKRVPRAATTGRGAAFVSDDVLISARPPEVEGRAIPGDWEGDLIIGANSSAIGTLVERQKRYVVLLHLPPDPGGDAPSGHGADAVRKAIQKKMSSMPKAMVNSITWDQGSEMAHHAKLTEETGIRVYFCDPHSPWQRGTNENTNGLLRQYFPKGDDLSVYTASDLDAVAEALNNRPRKTLGWKTPLESMNEFLPDFVANVATLS